jgi:drug/metabolite transporter (DMT)-like permease
VQSRKPLDLSAILIMFAICFIWGIQQIGIKATAADASPVMQIGLRSGGGALLVLMLVLARGERIRLTGGAFAAGFLASLLFSIEFLMIGEALKRTSASHVVVFLYTAPIFAALALHWKFPAERLAAVQWLGIGLASLGIIVAFLGREAVGSQGAASAVSVTGDLLALVAGALWGTTTFVIRATPLSQLPAAHTLFYQLAGAFLLLTSASFFTGQAHLDWSWALVGNLAFQVIIVSFFSFLAWFWLLTRYVASQLGVFSFFTPLFGVIAGWLLLSEPLDGTFLIGASLVMAGIIVVSAYPWLRRRAGRDVPVSPG